MRNPPFADRYPDSSGFESGGGETGFAGFEVGEDDFLGESDARERGIGGGREGDGEVDGEELAFGHWSGRWRFDVGIGDWVEIANIGRIGSN